MKTSSKAYLRNRIRQKRRNLPQNDKLQLDHEIARSLYKHPLFQQAQIISIYVSLPFEIETHTIITTSLTQYNKRIVVPKIQNGTLQLYEIFALSDLHKGAYGILEPNTTSNLVNLQSIQLFIVPGLVFSKKGDRIGFGKGFYDQLLRPYTGPVMAFAYDFQLFNTIPNTTNDRKVDIIITPTKIYDLT